MQGSEIVRGAVLASVLVCALATTGCASEKSENGPPKSTSAPTPPAAWEDGLSDEQVNVAYEGMGWLNTYDSQSEAIWREGKATVEAKEFFQDHVATWTVMWDELQQFEAAGITDAVEPGWEVSTVPTEVAIDADGSVSLDLDRCVDASKLQTYVNGEVQPQPDVASYTQYIELTRYPDGRWLLDLINADVNAPCDLS